MRMVSIFITFFIFLGCNKSVNELTVELYMDQVVAGKYDKLYLPDFEPSDISKLLEYRNDKMNLESYPYNPISSFIADSVTAGMIAIWTIESIRISELNGDTDEYKRFPSLNPIIRDSTNKINNRFVLQDIVANIYYNWWFQADISEVEKIKINPLEDSNFAWF